MSLRLQGRFAQITCHRHDTACPDNSPPTCATNIISDWWKNSFQGTNSTKTARWNNANDIRWKDPNKNHVGPYEERYSARANNLPKHFYWCKLHRKQVTQTSHAILVHVEMKADMEYFHEAQINRHVNSITITPLSCPYSFSWSMP
jgi:hypothetical protein